MKTNTRLYLAALATAGLAFLSSCDKDDDNIPTPGIKPDIEVMALSSSNQLVKLNAKTPGTITSTVTISGLTGGEKIIAIDYRPATGQLYGVSDQSRLYILNTNSGAATMVGAGPFTPAITGTAVGFDFNPTVDRIRLVTNTGLNLRLNPETGTVAATDIALNPGTPGVTAVAYTNSVAGASTTTLFDLDNTTNKLYKQEPPNNGSLVEVGSTGITTTAGSESGFDISSDNTVSLVVYTSGTTSTLYQLNLTTGAATSLGTLGAQVIGIAIPTTKSGYAISSTNDLQIFDLNGSGSPVTKNISGLQPAESILGIDFRPINGQLYALGSTSRLYTINLGTGAATQVGTGQFTTLLSGTQFGFDFNPTVDRIRVVSNTGQNLRLNPNDGTVAAVDLALNPGTPAVSAAAYTNNIPAATSTVLLVLDATTDKLYRQDPPNNGTLVELGSLGVDITADNGFDITGNSSTAYGVFTAGGITRMYTLNTTTGAATAGRTLPNGVRAFAAGIGY